jgi:hypothetical protein
MVEHAQGWDDFDGNIEKLIVPLQGPAEQSDAIPAKHVYRMRTAPYR